MFLDEGVLNSITLYEDPEQGRYWLVAIDGEPYRVWDRKLLRGLIVGEQVSYKWRGQGLERDLVALEPTSRSLEPGVSLDARELYIRYMYERQPREVKIKLDRGKTGQYSWEIAYEGEDPEQVIKRLKEVDEMLKEEYLR